MINFDQLLNTLAGELEEAAKEFGGELKDSLIKDGTSFALQMKGDIERWSAQLASGDLSKGDFEFLLKAKQDLAKMEALKQKGLAKVQLDRLKASVATAVTNSVFKVIP